MIGYSEDQSKQREKLIDSEEMAWESHDTLERGKRKAIEAEKMSFDIMLNLDRQNNQMKGIRDNLFLVNNQIGQSESLINKMFRHHNKNKIYIATFIISLVIAFTIFLVLFK